VKTLDKDLIAIEEDFKSRFSLFNCKILTTGSKDEPNKLDIGFDH
jgi:hypothetical protein